MAERIFTVTEINYINDAYNDEEKDVRFLKIWTKKEAFFKFIGGEISKPLNLFNVFDIYAKNKTIELEEYILSVCTSDTEETEIIIEYRTETTALDKRALQKPRSRYPIGKNGRRILLRRQYCFRSR